MQASTTKTSTFTTATLDLGGAHSAGIGQPVVAIVTVTACDGTSGDETYTFQLQESSDDSSYSACGQLITLARGTTGTVLVPAFRSKRYLQLVATLAGTTPSVTFSANLAVSGVV